MISISHLLNRAKDALSQRIAACFINSHRMKGLGKVTTLNIDSEKNEVSMVLELHGEQAPIAMTIRYKVRSATSIEVVGVDSSRSWIASLVNDLIPAPQKTIEVPAYVTKALSKIIK